jgi:hypothetical protein
MRITEGRRIAFVVAAVVIPIASSAVGATAATGRNAAMQNCMSQARASVDVNLGAVHNQRRQTAIYRSCMREAGFRP